MKRIVGIFFALCVLLLLSLGVSASFVYTDPETHSSFTLPEGWHQEPLTEQRDFLDVKFVSDDGSNSFIMFGSFDVYGMTPEEERGGFLRHELDENFFTAADFAAMYSLETDDITMVTGDNCNFYVATHPIFEEVDGEIYTMFVSYATTMYNGYAYSFQFYGSVEKALESSFYDKHYPDFLEVLSSLEHTPLNVSDVSGNSTFSQTPRFNLTFSDVIINLILTILLICGPFAIYRYIIKKAPISRKKAKILTITYGVIWFLILSIYNTMYLDGKERVGNGILLWSIVSYRMLISGKQPEPPQEISPHVSTATDSQNLLSPTLQADEARIAEIRTELQKIPVQKVKQWYAEGRLTEEQYHAVAKKYNALRKEKKEIEERIELLQAIDNGDNNDTPR